MPIMQYLNNEGQVVNVNAEYAEALKEGLNTITANQIGILTDLQTTTQVSFVEAINSLVIKDNLNNKFKWGIENGILFLQEV